MRLLNITSIVFSLLILPCLLSISQIHAQVFVDQNAGGTNDGSSWTNAFRDLQTALTLTNNGQIWVAKGTYKPINCNPCTELDKESAFRIPPDVQLYGGFEGTESSLAQRDWNANPTVLSGDIGVLNDSLDNVFNVLIAVNSTVNNVLDGFIIEEGNADGPFGFAAGGGILIDANPGGTGDIRIRNCTFRNNYGGGGGAIAIDCVLGGTSQALISNCLFENNTASLRVTSTGAAIFMQGNSAAQLMPRIVGCTFRNNYCGNDGGAISATPTGQGTLLAMEIDSCLFSNNRADDRGGAIWYRMSSFGESRVTIKNSQFTANASGGEGGAIYARSSFDNIANDTIANCLFSLNQADGSSTINNGEGGAIFLRGSQQGTRNHLIVNCVFDRNNAVQLGGAIATTSIEAAPGVCATDIINCSFYGNTTLGAGRSIHAQDSTGTNSIRIANSILWQDSVVPAGLEIFNDGSTVSLINCDIAGGLPPGIIDGGNNLDIDPQFADPENGDLHLPSCSPLIDQGDNGLFPSSIATDLDGDLRFHAGAIDLGAYEIGIIYVDESASGANNGRSWTNAFHRFEDALAVAAAGDQIWVAQGTYRPTDCAPCTEADKEATFHLPPNVEVYGGFAGSETLLNQRDWVARPTILSGDIGTVNDSLDNVFNVLIAENSTEKTILDGFIIEEGNADGPFGFSAGGGLLMDANPGGTANMQVRNCTFRNNYGGGGGAIAIDCVLGGESKAEIRDCIFEHNTASLRVTSTGAAIFMQGNSGAQIMPRIVNCTFRDNFCGNDGGAISATPTGEGSLLAMEIDSCLFTNNRANDRGGAVWYRMSSFGESRVVLKNSQFTNNRAGGEGGALYTRSSFENVANDTIINCLFSQNESTGSSTVNEGEGGAVFIRGSQESIRNHTIINSVFDRNSAALLGGAIATTSIEASAGTCNVDIVNCTFSENNTSGNGGALHVEGSEGVNTMTVRNSILWGNQAAINGKEIMNQGASVSVTFSDIEGGVPAGINDAGNNLDEDPQFKDPTNGDLHLGPCSPAIDAGSNDLLLPDLLDMDQDGDLTETTPVDLDGFDRVFLSMVDLGAYEFDGSEAGLTVAKSITNESCGDACDGAVTLQASGGQAGYTFSWSNGQAAPSLENLCAGTYYVTINDASTCTLLDSITIEAGDTLSLMVSPDTEICVEESTEISASASGGNGILTYNWGGDLGTGDVQTVNPQITTTYSVTVSDSNNCIETDSVTVTVFDLPVPVIQGTSTICPGTLTHLDAGAFATYAWSTGANTQEIEVSEAGQYAVTVTDTQGCSGTAEIEIVLADSLMTSIQGSPTFCPGGSTILEGAPGFATYAWSTGAIEPSIEVSEAGTYSLTVTDAAGCSGSATIVTVESASLSPMISGNSTICPGTTTHLNAGAFATYTWSTGANTQEIEVSEAGLYAVTVTDTEGCSGTAALEIVLADSLMTSIQGSPTFCPGGSTILEGAPGFATYAWSTGAIEPSIEVSEAGTYSLTVTDAAGCSGSATIVTVESASLSPTINGSLTFCEGTGTILSVGTFATYQWSTGATTQQISIVNSGIYGVTVSDGNGCTGSTQVTARVQSSPPLQISGITTFCPGDSTVLDAGPGYHTYQWSDGAATQRITVKSEGTYSLTVSDETGCTATDEVMISFDLPEEASAGTDPGGCTDTLSLLANLPPGAMGRWTSDDPNVFILDPTAPNTEVTNIPENGATLSWTLSTQDCPDYSSDRLTLQPGLGPVAHDDQVTIPAAGLRSIRIDLLANDVIPGGNIPIVTILTEPSLGSVDGIANGILSYTAPEGAFGTVSLPYELCVEGCPCSTATVIITIEAGDIEEIEVANTITPNGDGFNDSFVFDIIRNTPPEASPDNELIVFNRWGDIVFQMENYDNTWNGVNNQGADLPEATYYYILRLNIGEGLIIRGDLTIIR